MGADPLFRHIETPNDDRHTALAVLAKVTPQLLAHIQIPSHMRSRLSVEDILQDVARTILRTTLSVNYTEDDWTKVIFAIAFRQLRKQVRLSSGELPPKDWTKAQYSPDSQWAVDLLDSLHSCTPRQKRIVGYRLTGFSNREIAEREGMCEGSVRRVLDKVAVFLEEDDD